MKRKDPPPEVQNESAQEAVLQDQQDLILRLNQSGTRLSKGHRRIAEYIVQHYDKAVFMTASKLGERVGVSESTVVRFAASLGYEGYPQLQRALQELVRHRLTAVQRFEMAADLSPSEVLPTVLKADMQNIRQTIEEIDIAVFDNVVERILNARQIFILGVRAAAPLASFLAYYLNFVFDNVHVAGNGVVDVFERIARIGAEDVLIGISFPRYSTRTLEAMGFAKSRGAQVIAITDGPMSPLADASSICLTARTDMASFVDSLAAPLSVINALIVALGLHRREELSRHFALLEGIWNEYHVYLERDKA
jgi:DNA-binding MurR/RpiR family transcriptional regulator